MPPFLLFIMEKKLDYFEPQRHASNSFPEVNLDVSSVSISLIFTLGRLQISKIL